MHILKRINRIRWSCSIKYLQIGDHKRKEGCFNHPNVNMSSHSDINMTRACFCILFFSPFTFSSFLCKKRQWSILHMHWLMGSGLSRFTAQQWLLYANLCRDTWDECGSAESPPEYFVKGLSYIVYIAYIKPK